MIITMEMEMKILMAITKKMALKSVNNKINDENVEDDEEEKDKEEEDAEENKEEEGKEGMKRYVEDKVDDYDHDGNDIDNDGDDMRMKKAAKHVGSEDKKDDGDDYGRWSCKIIHHLNMFLIEFNLCGSFKYIYFKRLTVQSIKTFFQK